MQYTQETEKGIPAALANLLAERGYTVHCGIGTSGFRIDTAVVHPDDPDRYVLALLCGAVLDVLHTQVSVPQSELLRSAARRMGFARMTPAIETAMTAAVRIAVQRGQAKEENGQILLP